MKAFRHPEDRAPVALFLAYFVLDLVLYATVSSPWLLALYVLAGLVPKACIAAWNHHHQHVLTFSNPFLNRALELVYGFQTGMTSNAWVLHHVLGHHLDYLDQTRDASGWKRRDGTTMGVLEYSLTITFTAYPRAFAIGLRRRRHLPVFVAMVLVSLALAALAVAYRPVSALFLFVLTPIASLFLTSMATYRHHSGLDTDEPLGASRNVLHARYNTWTGNLGFHTAHHLRPGVHWSRLPALHAELVKDIPAELFLDAGFPWSTFDGEPHALPTPEAAGQGAGD